MNKKMSLVMIASIIAIMLFSAGCDLSGTDSTGNGGAGFEYAKGDTGSAGGLIFYIDESGTYSWTYLEVAPASTEWTIKEWGANGTEIGGDAALTGIGEGQAATAAIVQHLADNTSETDRAAQLCDALSEGGYSDWFLPSKDELNAIWDNIVDNGSGNNSGVGGFANENYWSSSGNNSNNAWKIAI